MNSDCVKIMSYKCYFRKGNECCSAVDLKLPKKVIDLSDEDQELVWWRSEIRKDDSAEICFYHENLLLNKFSFLINRKQRCSDVFGTHRLRSKPSKVIHGDREIGLEMANKLRSNGYASAVPGKHLCPRCYSRAKDLPSCSNSVGSLEDQVSHQQVMEESLFEEGYEDEMMSKEEANSSLEKSLKALEEEPLPNLDGLSRSKKKNNI